jgi:RND family efflux transporter MFP subunit
MQMSRRWKALIILGGAAIVALGGWQAFRLAKPARAARSAAGPGNPGNLGNPNGPANSRPRGGGAPVAVDVAPVSRATLRDTLQFTGSLESRSRVVVAAKVAGRLERLPVRVGQPVRRGELLAEMDPEEFRQAVEQASAEVAVARANLESAEIGVQAAERELERVRSLQDKQIASDAELESSLTQLARARVQVSVARAQLRQREVALETARLRVAQTRLLAEWDLPGGPRVVGERLAEPGTLLRAGDAVLSLLELDPLVARLKAAESVYPRLRPGLGAVVTAPVFPGRRFAGAVSEVAPFLDQATGQAEAWVEIRNADGTLKPGMAVRVELEFGRRENAQAVPVAALVVRGETRGLFQVEPEGPRVRFLPVRTGAAEGGLVEILEPVLRGPVVILGQHLLEDGSAVILPQ